VLTGLGEGFGMASAIGLDGALAGRWEKIARTTSSGTARAISSITEAGIDN
jgi:hypothetical protein